MTDSTQPPSPAGPAWNEPYAGRVFRHFKTGGLYTVLCAATIEATKEDAVVYQCSSSGRVWVRPRANFMEEVRVDGSPLPVLRFSPEN